MEWALHKLGEGNDFLRVKHTQRKSATGDSLASVRVHSELGNVCIKRARAEKGKQVCKGRGEPLLMLTGVDVAVVLENQLRRCL